MEGRRRIERERRVKKMIVKKLLAMIRALEKRIKALEQKDSYYPNKEEIPYIKVGGTD